MKKILIIISVIIAFIGAGITDIAKMQGLGFIVLMLGFIGFCGTILFVGSNNKN